MNGIEHADGRMSLAEENKERGADERVIEEIDLRPLRPTSEGGERDEDDDERDSGNCLRKLLRLKTTAWSCRGLLLLDHLQDGQSIQSLLKLGDGVEGWLRSCRLCFGSGEVLLSVDPCLLSLELLKELEQL